MGLHIQSWLAMLAKWLCTLLVLHCREVRFLFFFLVVCVWVAGGGGRTAGGPLFLSVLDPHSVSGLASLRGSLGVRFCEIV